MFSDVAAANRDGLTRKERMRDIQSAMDTRSYRSLVQDILEELDQEDEAERHPVAKFS
jgi:hypothetical protein